MANRKKRQPNVMRGACAGAVAGLAGSWAMVRFNHLIAPSNGRSDKSDDEHAHRRVDARPNDTDGTLPDEPGSSQAADALAKPMLGRRLSEGEKQVAGPVIHYLFGATVGALYGAAAEVDRTTTRGAGLAYGTGVWLIADELGMHAAGFATKPTDYPVSRHAAALATHLVFGFTVEAVRRALRGRPSTGRRSSRPSSVQENPRRPF